MIVLHEILHMGWASSLAFIGVGCTGLGCWTAIKHKQLDMAKREVQK